MSPYPENESAYKIGWEHLATSSIDLAAAEGKSEIPVIVRIGRLGRLFQLMMLIIRQRANPLDAQEVLVEDGQIIIKKIPNGDGKFTPFLPKCDDKGALQMASLKDSGFEAMVYLYHIAGRVMITPQRVFKSIKEVRVAVANPRTAIVFDTGSETNVHGPSGHYLWKLEQANGRVYALDPTGVQFGYADPVGEWSDIIKSRNYIVIEENDFGTARDMGFNKVWHFPRERAFLINFSNVCKLTEELNKFIEREFPNWFEAVAVICQIGENEFYEDFLRQVMEYFDRALKEVGMVE